MEKDTVNNRHPAVAGSFYPSNRDELEINLRKLFSSGTPNKKLEHVVAVISPHAGYVYSGTVAASAYNQLSPDHIYDNVFLIGSSHHANFDGAALYAEGHFITPLGVAQVNLSLTRKLIADNPEIFHSIPDVQANEHSLEVQVPFLQYIYKEQLQIIPIIIAAHKPGTIKKIAEALKPYFGGNNLFVVSTDFSHYPDYQSACSLDAATANAIISNSASLFVEVLDNHSKKGIQNLATSICGWTSVLALLDMTEQIKDVHYYEINYMNSGDAPYGDKKRVVGYHAIVITKEQDTTNEQANAYHLSEKDKNLLLHMARVTIEQYLTTGKIPEAGGLDFSEQLMIPAGAFVTLTKNGNLRGCIGQFYSEQPLYKTVQEMAVSAAFRDHRFTRVTQDELSELNIEISVLSPMRKIDTISEIKLGEHGIYIKKGPHSGTFLPQVARQTGWNMEDFLGHCSRDKAGIGWSGWKDAEIYIYEAYVFGEQ